MKKKLIASALTVFLASILYIGLKDIFNKKKDEQITIPKRIKNEFLNSELSTLNVNTSMEYFFEAHTCEEISEKADLIVIGSPKKDLFDEKVYTESHSEEGATLTIKYTLPEIKVDEFIKGSTKDVKVIQYSYIDKNEYGEFVLTNGFLDWPMRKDEKYILFLDRNENAPDERYFIFDSRNKFQIGGEVSNPGNDCRDFILDQYKDKIEKLNIKPVYSKDIKVKPKWEDLMIENEAGCYIRGIRSVCKTDTGKSIPVDKFLKARLASEEIWTK